MPHLLQVRIMLTSEAARAAVRKEAAVRRALGEQRATTTVQQDSAVQRIVRRCRIVRCAEGSWRIVRWRVVRWRMVRRIVRWRT